MTQQAFINLRISGLTEKMLIEALGRRALAGTPISADELIREWADQARATIYDRPAKLLPTEAEFTEPPTTTSWNSWARDVLPWHPPRREPDYPSDPGLDPESAVDEYIKPGLVMPVSREALAAAAEDREIGLDDSAPAPVLHPKPEDAKLLSSEARHTPELDSPDRDPAHPEPAKRARRTKNEMALARNAVTNAYRAAVGNSSWYQGWETANVAGLAAADVAGANAGLTPYQTRQTLMPIVAEVREQFDEPRTSAADTDDHGPDDAAVQRVEDIVTNEQPPKHAEPALLSDGTERVTGIDAASTKGGLSVPGGDQVVYTKQGPVTPAGGPIISDGPIFPAGSLLAEPAELFAGSRAIGMSEPEPAEALAAHYNEAPIQSTTPDPAPLAEVAAIHGLPTPSPGSVWVPSPASSDDDVFAQFLNG